MELFAVVYPSSFPGETEAQRRAGRRETQAYHYELSILRKLAHEACHEYRMYRSPQCRRARSCVTDRDPNDWGFPGPWMLPCARTETMIELIRKPVRYWIKMAFAPGGIERQEATKR